MRPEAASTRARAAALLLAGVLSACASHAPRQAGALWSGRLQLHADAADGQAARSMSGAFELSGTPLAGQLLVTTPLGTVAARARWHLQAADSSSPDDLIILETTGPARRYDTLDAMVTDALGQALPLAALFDWLAGRPWPQAPAEPAAEGAGFRQLGWSVDLSRLAAERRLEARREAPPPALRVRVQLDAPAAGAAADPG